MTEEIRYKVVSEEPFMLKYGLDRYKTQEMCDKVADAFLPTLKFVPDWPVTNEMIKNLYNALFAEYVLFFDDDCGNVTFSSNGIDIHTVNLNDINLFVANFYEDDQETIINAIFMA